MKIDSSALELAKTHHHTLGSPRNFRLDPSGAALFFTRSDSATSNHHSLWRYTLRDKKECRIFDPAESSDELTPEELKLRERLREASQGVTQYQVASSGDVICCVGGDLWLIDCKKFKPHKLRHVKDAFDPRFSPDGKQLAYTNQQGVWIVDTKTNAKPQKLVANKTTGESYWGRAEFIASEEFERYRGFWWSTDGTKIAVTFVDESPIKQWHGISTNPEEQPPSFRYPAAGQANATVKLFIIETTNLTKHGIVWDNARFPYLLNAQWHKNVLCLTVQSRDQKTVQLLKVENGIAKLIHETTDSHWVDVLQTLPAVTDGGVIISAGGSKKRQLFADNAAVSPSDLHVESYIGMFKDWIIYDAAEDPKTRTVYATNKSSRKTVALSASDGLFSAICNNEAIYVFGTSFADNSKQIYKLSDDLTDRETLRLNSLASAPRQLPKPIFFTVGKDNLQACLVLPKKHSPETRLPILIKVYGGPHHQQVLLQRRHYYEAQWWADQGFAVLLADGPGTPGHNLQWERAIYGDLIGPIASAQTQVLRHAIKKFAFLDSSKVAVQGWSFGGYLAAYLPILYPELFHVAIAGAPVTDWRLYDTHYTERYLGMPDSNPHSYDKSSLLLAARKKAKRPTLLVHGLHDDNVVINNSLQLIDSYAEAGCPFNFIPLSSASHFLKQAEQTATLMQQELDFLQYNLAL